MKLVRTLSMIIALAGVSTAHADTPPAKAPAEKGAQPSPPPSNDTILEFARKSPELEPLTKLNIKGYCVRYSHALKNVSVAAHVRKASNPEMFLLKKGKLVKVADSEQKLLLEEYNRNKGPGLEEALSTANADTPAAKVPADDPILDFTLKAPEFEPLAKLNIKGYCVRYSHALKGVTLVAHVRKAPRPETLTLKKGKLVKITDSEKKLLLDEYRQNKEDWPEEPLDRAQ